MIFEFKVGEHGNRYRTGHQAACYSMSNKPIAIMANPSLLFLIKLSTLAS